MKYADKRTLLMIGAGALVLLYLKGKAEKVVSDAVDAVDITSDKNIVYTGVNKIFHALGGDQRDTLGTWIYGVFN